MTDGLDIGDLCRRYGPMVLRRCRRLLCDEGDALDACQDVFVRVIERRRMLDVQHPSTLLYCIATSVCLTRIRDQGRLPEGHRVAGGAAGHDWLERIAHATEPGGQNDASRLLDWLFDRQPESGRTMAVLHYIDGLTLEEVAQITGLSVRGVRKRLGRLRHVLREAGPGQTEGVGR